VCKEELEISEVDELEKQSNGDKVVEGILICKGFPKHKFRIKNKIVVLIPESSSDTEIASIDR
jgi:uncharacterized protein YbaR (Trm112 family)